MDKYHSLFSDLDEDNSGQIDIKQLKQSIEQTQENDFRSFMNDEINQLKTNTIDFKTFQG